MTYVQLNITGRKRDKRTGLAYRWSHTCLRDEAETKRKKLLRLPYVRAVQIVERGAS